MGIRARRATPPDDAPGICMEIRRLRALAQIAHLGEKEYKKKGVREI